MSFYFPYNNSICDYWWHFYNIRHYKSSMMEITVTPKISVIWPVAFSVTSIKSMTTLESNCMHLLLIFTLKSIKKIKNTLRQTWWIHFSNSQLPISPVSIFQQHQHNQSWDLTTRTLCAQYSDFLDRAQLLTQKLLKQGYLALMLISSL